MPVISESQIISGAVDRALFGVKIELSSINHKLDKLTPSQECCESYRGTTLHSKGKMVWWIKSKDASCYRLRLFIEDDEIDVIKIERNTAYHTFKDLNVDLEYEVLLEIENRNGKVINKLSYNYLGGY